MIYYRIKHQIKSYFTLKRRHKYVESLKWHSEYTNWHNLINNPNDVPDTISQVLIAYEYNPELGYSDFDIGEYWGTTDGWGDVPTSVKGWKYIN